MFFDFLVRRLPDSWDTGKALGVFWTNCFHKAMWTARGGRRQRWEWDDGHTEGGSYRDYECKFLHWHILNDEITRVFQDPETDQTYLVRRLETRKLAHYNPHARFMG